MMITSMHTGMRQGELRNLRWSHIDRENWFARLPGEITKNKQPRDVPLNRHVQEALKALPRALNDYVFTYNGKPLRRGTHFGFEMACKRSGITYGLKAEGGVRFHDIRGTMKTNMLQAGVDKALRDVIIGHRLQGMDAYYLRFNDEHLGGAMDRYTEWWDSQGKDVTQTVTQIEIIA